MRPPCPGGTRDGCVDLGQSDVQESGIKRVELLDRPGGTIMQAAAIAWDWDTRQASILTAQPASWDAVQRTVTEADLARQTAPGIAATIQGRTVFVSYVTPSDQAIVQITRADSGQGLDPVGLAAKEILSHPGGTTQGAAQLAIPATLPRGPLTLQLFDKPYGTVIASLNLQWDGTTLTLAGDAAYAASTTQQHALLTSAAVLRPDIARIERLSLFSATPYAITGDRLEALVRAANPSGLFPSDEQAEITRRWQAGPTYSRGWYEDQLHTAQFMKLHEFQAALNNYETAMSNLVMAAVQFWVDLKNGAAQQPEIDRLRATCDATNIDGLRPLGVLKPSLESITNEGHRLFTMQYDYMLRVQDDNAQARLADALHAQQAEERAGVVAQQARALDRILARTVAADPAAADAISRLEATDPQLTAHWAEELVGTDGPMVVDDQTLVALLTARLNMALTVAGLSDSNAGSQEVRSGGDVLSAMTPETLTRILHDADAGLQSALARHDQPLIDHFTRLKVAAEGLLSDWNNASSPKWMAYIERTTTDPAVIEAIHAPVLGVRTAALSPDDPQYNPGQLLRLLPLDQITDDQVRTSRDRVQSAVEAGRGLLDEVYSSDLEAVLSLSTSQVKTIITSLCNGSKTWAQAVASAKGIGEIQAARLLHSLPEAVLNGIVLDIVLTNWFPGQAETGWKFDIGMTASTSGLTLVLRNLAGVSQWVASDVGGIVYGVFSHPQQITDPAWYPYIISFDGKAAIGRSWDADAARLAIEKGDKASADQLYQEVAGYYRDLKDAGKFTEGQYQDNLDRLEELYRAIRAAQLAHQGS